MSEMATVPEMPEVPGSRGLRGRRSTAAWVVAVLVGSAVLGLLGGVIWGEFAPRAMLQEIGAGTAQVINVETRAYFGADVWFSAITVVAGLLAGLLGYRFAVAPRDGTGPRRRGGRAHRRRTGGRARHAVARRAYRPVRL